MTQSPVPVFVVEDEALIQSLLEDVLHEAGFAVIKAYTGVQAISMLQAPGAEYQALITDIKLSREGPMGWDVARRARELIPTLPVIYMTGNSAADWASLGVADSVLLAKPFAPAQVATAVATLLDARAFSNG